MKKVLSTVAALGLVAGIATSAAALELKVKGDYLVEGYSISNGMGILGGAGLALTESGANSTDSYFQHKFTINADLKVNDSITMKSRIRLVDYATIWGSQDDTSVGNGSNFAVKRLWMVYKSPIGQWEIGRRPAGAWEGTFINNGTRADRIMWKSGKMLGETFSMYAFYQKSTESDAYTSDSNRDNDYYEVYGAFTGYGKTSLAVGYKQDNTSDVGAYTTVDAATVMVTDADGNVYSIDATTPGATAYGSSTSAMRVKGYGKYPLADMLSLEFEFDHIFGDKDINNPAGTSIDIDSWAFMTALDADFGAASANFMYFYISGDDNGTTDGESSAYSSSKGTGNDFEPLYILTGTQTGILNNDIGSSSAYGAAARTAGVHGLVAAGDFKASDKLSFHGAFGIAEAADEMTGYDSDYGYEIDAGLAYKLLDNLTYNLHFGWMSTGDFFQMGDATAETNDITLLYNKLYMTF